MGTDRLVRFYCLVTSLALIAFVFPTPISASEPTIRLTNGEFAPLMSAALLIVYTDTKYLLRKDREWAQIG
ncbi:hypothetical protein BZJ17_16620 [Salinivibrio sp. IB574]|nr:hypothetical protein BZJ17_16610 [Salinivibrio sp. IB574]OOF17966.1 hypothetical protein BZJ17_16620 [Salinivibrio sp. IB574]